MSAPVDVLNMLRKFERTYMVTGLKEEAADVALIHAVVAELIEAANRAAIAACRGDGSHSGTIRNADLDALRAALARIGDAS